MANFIKLTDSNDDQPIWVNMDLVEAFHRRPNGDVTVLVYAGVDQNEGTPVRYVAEKPEAIVEALIEVRGNNGYGFGGER